MLIIITEAKKGVEATDDGKANEGISMEYI